MSFQQILNRLEALLGLENGRMFRVAAQLLIIWVTAWLVNRLVRLIAKRIIVAVDDGDDSAMSAAEKRGQTIAQLLRSVGRAVIILAVVLLTLNQFLDIGPILAGFGILSLAVSFGAQSLVKDFISGFFILLENQFVVGDVVEIGSKSGVVERMTLRVVMLRDGYGSLHIIPNGTITSVSNLTRGWSRAIVEVVVGYSEDLDRVLGIFRDELAKLRADPAWQHRLDGIPELAGVESLTDKGVAIRSLIRTQPGAQWDVAREFRRRIKNRLDREGIPIPYIVPVTARVGTPPNAALTDDPLPPSLIP